MKSKRKIGIVVQKEIVQMVGANLQEAAHLMDFKKPILQDFKLQFHQVQTLEKLSQSL